MRNRKTKIHCYSGYRDPARAPVPVSCATVLADFETEASRQKDASKVDSAVTNLARLLGRLAAQDALSESPSGENPTLGALF